MNYIITKRQKHFEAIGEYNYCNLDRLLSLPYEIAYDSETTSLKPHKGEIFAIQIGTGYDNYLIDIKSIDIYEVFKYLKEKLLVIQNALFDLTWMYKYGFFPWKVRDTFLASKIIYNGIISKRHGFAYLMEEHLGINYDKSEQENIAKTKLNTAKAIQYCFNDVDKLLELKQELHYKIYDGGFTETYNLHCKWIRACAYMQMCGLPIDEQMWLDKIENDKKELKNQENNVIDYIFDNLEQFRHKQMDMFSPEKKLTVSLTSPGQMIKVFETFGIDVTTDTNKAGKSIAEDIIQNSKHPFVKIWLKYQGIKRDVTTVGENFLHAIHEERLYTSYKPILDTARISSGGRNKNKFEFNDVNTLNIPANEKSRKPFQARKGFKFLVCDYEGQENVCTADMSGDEVMISSIVDKLCLHCAFARLLYPEIKDLTDEEIKKSHSDKRKDAKSPRFALAFGGSGYTIHINENIPLERAMEIEELYKKLHPGIERFGKVTLDEAINKGYIEYAMGFKLQLPYFDDFKKAHTWMQSLTSNWWNAYRIGKKAYKNKQLAKEKGISYTVENTEAYDLYVENAFSIKQYSVNKNKYLRLCLNAPSQGTAAHQTKAATNKIYEHIWKNNHFWKARIALVVHDEIDMEVVDELADEYKEVIEYHMINEGNKFLHNPVLKMQAVCNINTNWYDAK